MEALKIVQGRIKAIEAYIEKEGETGYSDHSHYPSQVIFENLKVNELTCLMFCLEQLKEIEAEIKKHV